MTKPHRCYDAHAILTYEDWAKKHGELPLKQYYLYRAHTLLKTGHEFSSCSELNRCYLVLESLEERDARRANADA